jgi:hypothetical protein
VLIEVALPTLDESRANWDKLSASDRSFLQRIEAFQADFERHKLKDPSQLPEISDPSFVLEWDTPGEEGQTVIKHSETFIFSEPAAYEGYLHFIEVAKILRSRYGKALRDLHLFGDRYEAPGKVAEARKRLFSDKAGDD